MGLVLKRIYISILVTALFSLFLLGKFIDQVFDAQSDIFDHQEFVTESILLNSIAQELSKIDHLQLKAEVSRWSSTLDLQFTLEQPQNLSLSNELMEEVKSINGLVVDSGDKVEIIRSIEKHPQFFLILSSPVIQSKMKNQDSNLEVWLTILFYFSFCLVLVIWAFPLAKRLSLLNKMTAEFGAGEFEQAN